MHNTDLEFFIFSFCYVAIFEECAGMIGMNLELLQKYVDNLLIFVNFPWELGVAMSSLLPGFSQIMFWIWCVQNEHWRSYS